MRCMIIDQEIVVKAKDPIPKRGAVYWLSISKYKLKSKDKVLLQIELKDTRPTGNNLH